jgi:hypothetical protein
VVDDSAAPKHCRRARRTWKACTDAARDEETDEASAPLALDSSASARRSSPEAGRRPGLVSRALPGNRGRSDPAPESRPTG